MACAVRPSSRHCSTPFLLVAVGAVAWEAILRLFHPEPVASVIVMVVAAVGIVINGGTAWLFASGRKGDLNIRGAFLHMVADAGVSAGVVVAGLVILYTGWVWLDPLTSLVIVGVIVWGTWGLLRDRWQCRSMRFQARSTPKRFAGTSRPARAFGPYMTFTSGR